MSRQITTNTFSKGLLMDTSSLTPRQDSLSDCLNGTFCTMNGDDMVLLNDMGNGRVQTAYLPSGYVPVGTAELGGIIYIAAYNPLTNNSLIGSFPSPCEQELLDSENYNFSVGFQSFLKDGEIFRNTVRTKMEDTIYTTGDKFLFSGDVTLTYLEIYLENLINSNKSNYKDATKRIIKYKAAIMSGQVIDIIENLLEYSYTINNMTYKFPILPTTGNSVDDASKIKEARYNIYTGNLSGLLYLIQELAMCDTCTLLSTDGYINKFDSNFTITMTGEEKFAPSMIGLLIELYSDTFNKVQFECTLDCTDLFLNAFTDGKTYKITIDNILNTLANSDLGYTDSEVYNKLQLLQEEEYFTKSEKDIKWMLGYTVYPVINRNNNNYPAKFIGGSHLVDLSLIESGSVILSNYQYWCNADKLILNLGFNSYLKNSLSFNSAKLIIYHAKALASNNWTLEYSEISILKDSNLGLDLTFNYSELSEFKRNSFYIIKIEITINDISSNKPTSISFWRLLFTNNMFNGYYDLTKLLDFGNITPIIPVTVSLNNSILTNNNLQNNVTLGTCKSLSNYTFNESKSVQTIETDVTAQFDISYKISENNNIDFRISTLTADVSALPSYNISYDFPSSLDSEIAESLKSDANNSELCTINNVQSTISVNNIKVNAKFNMLYIAYTDIGLTNVLLAYLYIPILYKLQSNSTYSPSMYNYGLDSNSNNIILVTSIDSLSYAVKLHYVFNGNIDTGTSFRKLDVSNLHSGEFVTIQSSNQVNLTSIKSSDQIDLSDPKSPSGKLNSMPLWMIKASHPDDATSSYVYTPILDNTLSFEEHLHILKCMLNTLYKRVPDVLLPYYLATDIYTFNLSNINMQITTNVQKVSGTLYIESIPYSTRLTTLASLIRAKANQSITGIKILKFPILLTSTKLNYSIALDSPSNLLSEEIINNNTIRDDIGYINEAMQTFNQCADPSLTLDTKEDSEEQRNSLIYYVLGNKIELATSSRGVTVKNFNYSSTPTFTENSNYKVGLAIDLLTIEDGELKYNYYRTGDLLLLLGCTSSTSRLYYNEYTLTKLLLVKNA